MNPTKNGHNVRTTKARSQICDAINKRGYAVAALVFDRPDGWKAHLTSTSSPYSWWEYLGPNLASALEFANEYIEAA